MASCRHCRCVNPRWRWMSCMQMTLCFFSCKCSRLVFPPSCFVRAAPSSQHGGPGHEPADALRSEGEGGGAGGGGLLPSRQPRVHLQPVGSQPGTSRETKGEASKAPLTTVGRQQDLRLQDFAVQRNKVIISSFMKYGQKFVLH